MRKQTRARLDAIKEQLLLVKWNLVIMAAFCFGMAAYNYVTPSWGGLGMFMITPHDGLDGILAMLPWCGIALGVLTGIASFVSRSGWVLSWIEILMSLVMFVFGFWELFFPYDIGVYSQTWAFVGIFLAFFIMFIALHMDREGVGHWFVELCVAAATWIVSFINIMDFAGPAASQGLTSLTLFIAAWGFVYGAVALHGVGSLDESIWAPVRALRGRGKKRDAAAA